MTHSGRIGSTAGETRAPTLRSPALEQQFAEFGYVQVPLLSRSEVDTLRSIVAERLASTTGFVDLMAMDPQARADLNQVIMDAVAPAAQDLFLDHEFFLGAVLLKNPGEDSSKTLHMDWSMVDERSFVSGIVWVALDDSSSANGGLKVVPRSHNLDVPHRGSPVVHFSMGGACGETAWRQTVDVEVPAGDAVIFQHRLLHGGAANTTDQPRIAVALGFKPRAAQLYHFCIDEHGVTHRLAIDPQFFIEFDPLGGLPLGRVIEDVALPDQQWDLRPEEIARLALGGPTMT